MVVLNQTGEEVNAKVVYYGPGLSGKTTNLETIHRKLPEAARGQMVSMKTRTDRTLFFDFVPVDLGAVGGYPLRILLYTVPGQVYYNATRKLVLRGVDAVVFVADSSRAKLQENIDSLANLEENLNELGLSLDHLPWVIQYNKRDLPDAMPAEEMNEHLNVLNVPAYEATANTGPGVYETFRGIAGLLYNRLKNRLDGTELIRADPAAAGSTPAVVASSTAGVAAGAATGTRAASPFEAGAADMDPVRGNAGGGSFVPPAVSGDPATASHEESVDDAIDSALRELDAPSSGGAKPGSTGAIDRTRAMDSPRVDSAPGKEVGVDPQASEDDDLGRTVEFGDSTQAPDSATDESSGDFITDPMGSRLEPHAGQAPESGESGGIRAPSQIVSQAAPDVGANRVPAVECPRETPAAREVVEPPRPRPTPPVPEPFVPRAEAAGADADREVRAIEVPVEIRRSQLAGEGPVRLVLDIRVVEDA